MPFVEAKCTNCGAVLPVDSTRDAWVCGYCGTPFIVEKAIQQFNITNNISTPMVNVFGGDTADVLYNRALEWLKLKNHEKAIQVLRKMIEKYPGDVRGWSKLARLPYSVINPECRLNTNLPQYGVIVDYATQLGDTTVLNDLEKEAAILCTGIRTKPSNEHLEFLREILVHKDDIYNEFACVKELLLEGTENAEYYTQRMKKLNGYASGRCDNIRLALLAHFNATAPDAFKGESDRDWGTVEYVELRIVLIVGKIIVHDMPSFMHGWNYTIANRSITKAGLQQFFDVIDNRVNNKMCLVCGKKMPFSAKNTCGCNDGKSGVYLSKR